MVKFSGSLIAMTLLYGAVCYGVGAFQGIQRGHRECNHLKNNTGNPYSAIVEFNNGFDVVILRTDPTCREVDVERGIEMFNKLWRDSTTTVTIEGPAEVPDFRGYCD